MYNKIEKEYKNLDNHFDKFYWKWTTVISVIYIIMNFIFPNNDILIYFMYFSIFSLCVYYFINDFRTTLNIEDRKKKFFCKIRDLQKF